MPLGINFWTDFGGFWEPEWKQVGTKMESKIDINLEGAFSNIVLWLQQGLDFSGSGGPSWEQKSTKNQSKNGVRDGMHLGIDF